MQEAGDLPGDQGVAASGQAAVWQVAVPAVAEEFPAVRRELVAWAQQVGMSAEQTEATALATYEALANAAAHAYSEPAGTVEVHAAYCSGPERVEITVADRGCWRDPPKVLSGRGGRGLKLIRSLAETVEIHTSRGGTTVRMSWPLHGHDHQSAGALSSP